MNHPDQDIIDMIAKATPEPKVNEDRREALRRQVLDTYDQREAKTEPEHKPLFKFTGATIMKLAASFVLLAAVGFFAVIALTPSKAIAFEDVAREILKIETASFDISYTTTHADGTIEKSGTYKYTTRLPALLRTEVPEGDILLIDFAKNKMLQIRPDKKAVIVMDEYVEFNEIDDIQQNVFGEIQKHLRNAENGEDFDEITYENLGEKKINGTQAVGFRVLNPDKKDDNEEQGMPFNTLDIWADAETGGPIYLEFTMDLDDGSQIKTAVNNFVYNQKLDPKLFSFEAPEGYKLVDLGSDTPWDEAETLTDLHVTNNVTGSLKDLVVALGLHASHGDGTFPATLSSDLIADALIKEWEKQNAGKPQDDNLQLYSDSELNLLLEIVEDSFAFARKLDEDGIKYVYAGKGVEFGDADRPILWFKPKDAETYTVVYADLTIGQAEQAPTMP